MEGRTQHQGEFNDNPLKYPTPTAGAGHRTGSVVKAWDYEDGGISTGTITLAEIQNAPYHTLVKKQLFLATTAADTNSSGGEIVDERLKDVHSRDWISRVRVFDTRSDGPLPEPEVAACNFSRAEQVYDVWQLEELRRRVLESSVFYRARLVVVENILPPVMEVIGRSLAVPPWVFQTHVQGAWSSSNSALSVSSPVSSSMSLLEEGFTSHGRLSWETYEPQVIVIRYPKLFEVFHPSALGQREWRDECLRRASRHLQCRHLLPIFDVPQESKVQCIAFEHISFFIRRGPVRSFPSGERKIPWTGLVLMPSSVGEWSDGNLKVKRTQQVNSMRMASLGGSNPVAFDEPWLSSLKSAGHEDEMDRPLVVLEALLDEALSYWSTHLTHISRAVELLSNVSGTSTAEKVGFGVGVHPHQQVRALVVHGVAVLSEVLDSVRTVIDSRERSDSSKHSAAELNRLHERFSLLKGQLERHLPTLQHHIDIVVIQQQVHLQETQLEESRKAIQQADTIKRLTILAFVYIPIQTAASVFGMNVDELKSFPPIWIFFVTAIGLLLLTLLAAGWRRLWPAVDKLTLPVWRSTEKVMFPSKVVKKRRPYKKDELSQPQEPSWVI